MKLHLPKALFTAVMALFAVSQTAWAGEIWVNFGCDAVNSTVVPEGSGMPTGDKWNNVTSAKNSGTASGTYTLRNTDGAEVAQLTLQLTASSWGQSSHNENVLTQMQSSHLDVNNAQTWDMSIESDIYNKIDTLTLYFSGDNGSYDPVVVNGTSYIGGTNTTGNNTWGIRQYSTTMDANNTIILNDVGAFQVIMGDEDKGGRATISGMSIKYSSDNFYAANLASGNNAASGLTYQFNGTETTAEWSSISTGEHYLVLNGAEDNTSVYSVASGTTIKGIQANSNTVTLASDAAVTVNALWAKNDSTLKVTAILAENSDVQVGGSGQVEMSTSQNLGNLTLMGNLSIAGDAMVSLSGNNSVVEVGSTLSGAGKLNIETDAALTMDSRHSDLMGILSHTAGSGTINITGGGEAVLAGARNHDGNNQALKPEPTINSTTFSGVISMAADTKLVIGEKSTGGYTHAGWAVGLDNATIAINGGGLRFNGQYSTIGTLDVNSEDTVHVQDTYSASGTALTVKTLNLDAKLTLTSAWKAVLDIEKLQGTGDWVIGTNSNKNDWKINIGSIDSSGAITINAATKTNQNGELTESSAVVTLGADGESILNLGGNITNGGTLNIKGQLAGTSEISGGTIAVEDTASVSGNITFGSDITLGGTLANTGTVTLSGNVYIDSLSMLEKSDDVGYSTNDGKDGYITSGYYYVVKGDGDGATSSLTTTSTLYEGSTEYGAIKGSADGKSLLIEAHSSGGGVWYLNTQDFTIDGTDSNLAKDATGYYIAAGKTLTIDADQSDTMTAGAILAGATGEGNVILNTDASIASNVPTKATGNLTIGKNVTLAVGEGLTNTSNISSFTSVTLCGATLDINGAAQAIQNLTVDEAKSTLSIRNTSNTHQTYTLTGTTTLNADLDVIPKDGEHGTLVVKDLTGTGNLHASGGTAGWGATELHLEKLTNYSGKISVDSDNRTRDINYVEFGTDATEAAFTSLEELTLSKNAYALVHAKGNSTIKDVELNSGTLKYRTDYGAYTYTLNKVTVSGTSTIEVDGNASGGWYHGNVEIKNLQNAADSASGTLILKSDYRSDKVNTFNLDGGSFAGTIELQAAEGGDYNRRHALNINHETVAENAEIKLTNSNNARAHSIALGIGAEKVTIKGLSGGTSTSAVYSGKQASQSSSFATDGTTRTLEIATGGNDYTAEVAIQSNINLTKIGAGTQNISGDQSAMNGTLEASAGALNITNTGNAMSLAGVKATGGIVQVSDATNAVTVADMTVSNGGQVKGNSMTVTSSMTISNSDAFDLTGALVMSGATVNLSGFTLGTELNDPQYVYTLGTATGGITDVNGFTFTGPSVDGYKVDCLVSNANDINNVLAGLATADDSTTVNDTLYLVLTKEATTTPLTEVNVMENGSTSYTDGVLTLQTEEKLADFDGLGDKLNVVIGSDLWEKLVADYKIGTLVDVALKDADDNYFDLNGVDNDTSDDVLVTLNGIGTNNEPSNYGPAGGVNGAAVGSYVTAYIPEPTTSTLSLLALAALAVRRRRR